MKRTEDSLPVLQKCPTGIQGLDEITLGGLPKGRPTLVCGSAGSGKTLFAMEFLVNGATKYDEPGVFMAFEENTQELAQNVASLGFDLRGLEAKKKLVLDYVRIERSEIEETGEYDLEGLFVRLNSAVDSVGAKRVVLDTIESLFSGLSNEAILRAELRRLFRWLKDKGVTAIITGERGESTLTRYGLEEYVSDCVVLLDHRIDNQISTRRLRILKYRGSLHGTNEYPFLIDQHGISITPVTSLGLRYEVSSERVPSGILRLDNMLEGKGYFKGSTVLVSGTAGTGKTSISSHFAESVCKNGGKCLYFAFEESPSQIIRNMKSIGINLEPWIKKGVLQIRAMRSTEYGLEMHLVSMEKYVREFKPDAVVVDPISNLIIGSNESDIKSMLIRLIDFLKNQHITTLMTDLSHASVGLETTESQISSLVDTWIVLRDIELGGERNRGVYIIKSRGMAHSNQIREFLLTNKGVDLVDVYLGPEGVLTGSARSAQEAKEKAAEVALKEETSRLQRELERKRKVMEYQIAALKAEYESAEEEIKWRIATEKNREAAVSEVRTKMARQRKSDNILKKQPTQSS